MISLWYRMFSRPCGKVGIVVSFDLLTDCRGVRFLPGPQVRLEQIHWDISDRAKCQSARRSKKMSEEHTKNDLLGACSAQARHLIQILALPIPTTMELVPASLASSSGNVRAYTTDSPPQLFAVKARERPQRSSTVSKSLSLSSSRSNAGRSSENRAAAAAAGHRKSQFYYSFGNRNFTTVSGDKCVRSYGKVVVTQRKS